ncbi:HAD-IA family hydrolase [Novosphingobium lentum]|uniref:HAD-IA family hydrolase n=1 Tax=Novosphingobium lentum TaxID=145287 RepID=UPI0008326CE4|nr:HAD-IA family hydrolase [Novosphingobium lentum]
MDSFPFSIVGFDLDGTLLDTRADIGAALNHALEIAGRPLVPVEHVARLIGGGVGQTLRAALAESGGIVEAEVPALQAALLDYYAQNIAVHTRLFAGGEAMLADLAERGAKLAVVTNKQEALAVRVIEELGLADHFFTVIGGDTMGPGRAKPAPDPIHEMIRRAGDAGRAAFVGDTTYDIGAARAAGVPVIAVRFGFHDVPPDELGADAVIAHFDELVPALQDL